MMTMPKLRFNLLARLMHWTMAVLVLAMLFIGIGMVSTVSPKYHQLLTIHQSLGILILGLVAIRLVNRLINPPPPLPAGLPGGRPRSRNSPIGCYTVSCSLCRWWAGRCCQPATIPS